MRNCVWYEIVFKEVCLNYAVISLNFLREVYRSVAFRLITYLLNHFQLPWRSGLNPVGTIHLTCIPWSLLLFLEIYIYASKSVVGVEVYYLNIIVINKQFF